ncbi:hypothetical protein [Lactobacillus sp. CBA3605] [Lactiplantibacillus mudanjiangensis]|nr:hypothetical protein [Lactobacillus sp. CBA3605] [Lactiplantibacillus mudanjiangensis]
MRVTISKSNEWHRDIELIYARDHYLHGEIWKIKGMLALNSSIEFNGWHITKVGNSK